MNSDSPTGLQRARRRGPRRDLLVYLSLKIALLAAIYAVFFGPSHRPPSDAASTAAALVGSPAR